MEKKRKAKKLKWGLNLDSLHRWIRTQRCPKPGHPLLVQRCTVTWAEIRQMLTTIPDSDWPIVTLVKMQSENQIHIPQRTHTRAEFDIIPTFKFPSSQADDHLPGEAVQNFPELALPPLKVFKFLCPFQIFNFSQKLSNFFGQSEHHHQFCLRDPDHSFHPEPLLYFSP